VKPNDNDLFNSLSAKVGRKEYSCGGREKKAQRCGDGRKWQAFLQKRKQDAARRAKRTLG
jgi:hypothetical protein